jgi:hypothetical protein
LREKSEIRDACLREIKEIRETKLRKIFRKNELLKKKKNSIKLDKGIKKRFIKLDQNK